MHLIQEMRKNADARLETLAMYDSMLTALRIALLWGSFILGLITWLGEKDLLIFAALCIPAAAGAAFVRASVRAAYARQLEKCQEIQKALNEDRPFIGGGMAAE